MNKNTAIIGAGGTGRGFLARLLQEDGASVVFIDRDPTLIQKLKTDGEYKITYGKNVCSVQNFEAYGIEQEEAANAAAKADWIFTAVGNENLPKLRDFLNKVAQKRTDGAAKIIVCENGASPKNVLRSVFSEAEKKQFLITQGVIFCSSIPEADSQLNILSEDYNEIPYDTDDISLEIPFAHFRPQKNFTELLERKIYTYNCLSACIAYLGAYKGYTDYADAGNDPEILRLCHQLLDGLNPAISKKYQISVQEQEKFSGHALQKFSNRDISDTIYKNARAAIRKLSPDERIMGAISIMEDAGEDPEILYLTAAAALIYLKTLEEMQLDGISFDDPLLLLKKLNPQMKKHAEKRIGDYYRKLEVRENLADIIEMMIGDEKK